MFVEEETYEFIRSKYDKSVMKYICVAKESNVDDPMGRIHMQIIFYEKRTIYTRFMDRFLGKYFPDFSRYD